MYHYIRAIWRLLDTASCLTCIPIKTKGVKRITWPESKKRKKKKKKKD
jgi:hypothetical protein